MTAGTKAISCLAGLALLVPASVAHAGSALEAAVAKGANRLTADQISKRFIGRTGIWLSADGKKQIAIYYGANNDLHAKKVGGGWTGNGFYGVTDSNRICIAWKGRDKGRLRCLDVLVVKGVVTKFNADGSLNGTYKSIEAGKNF